MDPIIDVTEHVSQGWGPPQPLPPPQVECLPARQETTLLPPMKRSKVVTGWIILAAVCVAIGAFVLMVLYWAVALVLAVARLVRNVLWGWRRD